MHFLTLLVNESEKATGLNLSMVKLSFEPSSDPKAFPYCIYYTTLPCLCINVCPAFWTMFPHIWGPDLCHQKDLECLLKFSFLGTTQTKRVCYSGGICILTHSAGDAYASQSLSVIIFEESRRSMRYNSYPLCLYKPVREEPPWNQSRNFHLLLHHLQQMADPQPGSHLVFSVLPSRPALWSGGVCLRHQILILT